MGYFFFVTFSFIFIFAKNAILYMKGVDVMNIKILLKTLATVVGVYELMNLSYQLGKGRILGIMKENDLNANEALDAIKACAFRSGR